MCGAGCAGCSVQGGRPATSTGRRAAGCRARPAGRRAASERSAHTGRRRARAGSGPCLASSDADWQIRSRAPLPITFRLPSGRRSARRKPASSERRRPVSRNKSRIARSRAEEAPSSRRRSASSLSGSTSLCGTRGRRRVRGALASASSSNAHQLPSTLSPAHGAGYRHGTALPTEPLVGCALPPGRHPPAYPQSVVPPAPAGVNSRLRLGTCERRDYSCMGQGPLCSLEFPQVELSGAPSGSIRRLCFPTRILPTTYTSDTTTIGLAGRRCGGRSRCAPRSSGGLARCQRGGPGATDPGRLRADQRRRRAGRLGGAHTRGLSARIRPGDA